MQKGPFFWSVWFSKKCGPWTINVDLWAWFSEKCGPQPEKFGHLCMISWKMWTAMHDFLKMWTLSCYFMKSVDLNLNYVDLYESFSKKMYRPQPENCGPLLNCDSLWSSTGKCGPWAVILWKAWTFTRHFLKNVQTSTWKMWNFTHEFLKSVDLKMKYVDLYEWFSEKGGPQKICGPLH